MLPPLHLLLALAPLTGSSNDARLWNLAFPPADSFREARLVSSHDPTGGNDDGFTGRFDAPDEKGGRTLLDEAGPGALVRVWSANPTDAPLEFWFDDEEAPRRVVPFRALFDEATSGGWIAYPHLPFDRRLRVVARGPVRFYQFNVLSYDAPPPPPRPGPAADAVDDLRPAKAWLDARGQPIPTFAPLRFPITLRREQGLRASLRGSGAVTRLEIDAESDDPTALRRALLTLHVDGEATPRVLAPLADFFAIGSPGATIESAPLDAESGRLVCRFVLPFEDGLRLDVASHGDAPLRVDVRMFGVHGGGDAFGGSRFHARFRHTLTEEGEFVDLLRATGRGLVIGVAMTTSGPRGLTYLEGDEQALVDGRGPERYHGTGTEDFFNCGWYFADGVVHRPYHGVTHKDGGGVTAYRFLIPDPIPFHESIALRIEHGGANDEPGVEYGTMTYWYADRATTNDFRPLEPWMLAPPRRIVGYDRPARHVRSMEALSGFDVVPLESLSGTLGGPRYVAVDGRTPAAALRYAVDVPDRYRVFALHARTPDGGRATLSTTGLDRVVVASDAATFAPIIETELGVTRLDAGTHPLVIGHDGGGRVLVEGLRLEPALPFIRSYSVRGSWPLGEDGAGFEGPLARAEPWRAALAAEDGFLPLGAHVEPNQFVVADARFELDSPDRRVVTLRLGSDDWLRVFVNGAELYRNRIHRAPRPDQDFVVAPLRAGRNEIILRVANEDGGYGLFCRVSDPQDGLVVNER